MNKNRFEVRNFKAKGSPFEHRLDHRKSHHAPIFHWHRDIEILYVTKGQCEVSTNGIKYNISSGDFFIINSNLVHNIQALPSVEYHCLIIDSDFLSYNSVPIDKITYQSVIQSERLQTLFFEIIDLIDSNSDFIEAEKKYVILRLMLYLSKHYSAINQISSISPNENIKLALSYINSHINKKISIEDILQEIGLSRYYFFHLFKQNIGMSPIQYINMMRCTQAQKLLSRNEQPIHDIAIQCGFESVSYFSKTFKKYVGLLPSEYLKKHK